MEDAVIQAGAVPATIALLDGQACIGLTSEQIQRLAKEKGVAKVSCRDLGFVLARRQMGATTVAATMHLAHRAGIRVFATGGIGGVHRGHVHDVSADLTELARTPLVVVCSGAKAILDLPLTLEWLETAGVPIIGFGTNDFPAFYTRTSGLPLEARAETSQEVAAIVHAHWGVGRETGILVAVPVPLAHEVPRPMVEEAIAHALAEADEQHITGKAVTPFLLARVAELTGGHSLRANIALLLNNARIAGEIACTLTPMPLDNPRTSGLARGGAHGA